MAAGAASKPAADLGGPGREPDACASAAADDRKDFEDSKKLICYLLFCADIAAVAMGCDNENEQLLLGASTIMALTDRLF